MAVHVHRLVLLVTDCTRSRHQQRARQMSCLSCLESSLINSVAHTDREALRGPADKAMKVVEHRFGKATAGWAKTGSRI
jgi:hypothetical protein